MHGKLEKFSESCGIYFSVLIHRLGFAILTSSSVLL